MIILWRNIVHIQKKSNHQENAVIKLVLLKSEDVNDEAKNVVKAIKQLKEQNIIPHYGYVALLFRSVRYHANKIIAELKNNDIPYTVKGHGSFLDRKEIRTMLYMLSYVDPPNY